MKLYIYRILSLLVLSCSKITQPSNLLPKDKMAELLAELAIYNSITNYYFSTDTIYVIGNQKDIFAKYGIDSLSFQEQHHYYKTRMEEYSEIIDETKKIISSQLELAEKEVENTKIFDIDEFLEIKTDPLLEEEIDALSNSITKKRELTKLFNSVKEIKENPNP